VQVLQCQSDVQAPLQCLQVGVRVVESRRYGARQRTQQVTAVQELLHDDQRAAWVLVAQVGVVDATDLQGRVVLDDAPAGWSN
jgi:hypothetical protein